MKQQQYEMTIQGFLKFLIVTVLVLSASQGIGQNTATVNLPTGALGTATFSPAITSVQGQNYGESLVSAYVFKNSTSTRTVGVSNSIDNGTNWTAQSSLSFPSWQGTTQLTNMDEPQLTTLSSGVVLLAVKAWTWPTDSHEYLGENYQEQQGTIPTKCGIYICTSTDLGSTWSSWQVVEETSTSDAVTTSNNIKTFEHPRLAYRPEFQNASESSSLGYDAPHY